MGFDVPGLGIYMAFVILLGVVVPIIALVLVLVLVIRNFPKIMPMSRRARARGVKDVSGQNKNP